ncbi:site-specific DNA-methyltransferase [Cytobacillus sp. FSL R5-0569]|uniref:site-specific DNA-methyltransferase n=1 Tax=Cytobacillus sp. FSL R5-0569 TaxID=2921649 RepID=UPI0030FC5AF2
METRLLQEINTVLSVFPKYWEGDILLKTKVIEDLREYKKELIESLLSNDVIKEVYSLDIAHGTIFKIDEFISMLRYKNYWDNSYTRFSNEIGLTSDSKYLKYNTDVVLDFPHKDCVLEGGMTKEDFGKQEVYYHKVLAKDEIDMMLSPKVLTNMRKYDQNGEHATLEFDGKDNLIIKGNNLIALHSLRNRFAGKVKLIYIDPPYNTGGDSFKYNDRFNHSTWLTFMWNRLEAARDLLDDGGSIWLNIDDNEVHYLKVIMDSIFPNGFVANVLWQKRTSPDARATLGDAHDHILVYTNNVLKFKEQLKTLPLTDEQKDRFQNPDDDPRGQWVSSDFTAQGFRPNQVYTIVTPSGKEYTPPPGKCWKNIESEYRRLREEGRIWFGKNGDAMPRRKTYLSESPGRVAWTWWTNKEVGHNQEAKKESIALFGENNPFSTPKPERLIHRIVTLCTDESDLVLDFFAGSGTTAAVCHKMNRQYIAIEQITYGIDYTPERLKKVIEGEQGGISKELSWNGGGSFVYAELFRLNQQYVTRIQDAKSDDEINEIVRTIKDSAFLDYKINIDRLTNEDSEFAALSLDDKKKLLIESLDSNQMYLSYSEIDDVQYEIPESVKQFNHSFYQNRKVTVNNHEQ